MKYVLAHFTLAMLAVASGAGVTYLVVSNTTAEVNYAVAMLALFVMVMAWIPALIAIMTASDELGTYRKIRRSRRRRAMRRHPSRVH